MTTTAPMYAIPSTLAGSGPAISLAATAAFCFAGAAVLQHRAVADPGSDDDTLTMAGMRAAARTPGWLLGLALAVGGTSLHAVALMLAPLSVVQPIGVLAVPIAVLIAVVRTRKRPTTGVLIGVGLAVTGVGAFVVTAAGSAVSTPAADGAMLIAGLVVACLVGVLAVIGYAHTGWIRCVTCAMAGAAAFGLVSALMRAVSQLVLTGTAILLDPAVIAAVFGLVLALVVGGWLVQQAFAAGQPEVVVACVTVVDPIVAVMIGFVLLQEGATIPVSTWLLLAVAAAVAAAGAMALASHHPDALAKRAEQAPTRSREARREHALHRR